MLLKCYSDGVELPPAVVTDLYRQVLVSLYSNLGSMLRAPQTVAEAIEIAPPTGYIPSSYYPIEPASSGVRVRFASEEKREHPVLGKERLKIIPAAWRECELIPLRSACLRSDYLNGLKLAGIRDPFGLE